MAPFPTLNADDPQLLDAARRQDADAFERLVQPHRPGLLAHCYRMLGSAQDAEDALQDALVRAWRGLPKFEGRSSLKSWLYRIATNVCLRAIEKRPRLMLATSYGPAASPADDFKAPPVERVWLEPFNDELVGVADGHSSPDARYEEREAVELAFVAAMQHLPARQRAVLLLRDVLGFAPAEIAGVIDASPAAVSSALQRAHKAVDDQLPERSQQQTLRALGDRRLKALVGQYVHAWETGDVDRIVSMLAADATYAMPPTSTWFRGVTDIRAFLHAGPLSRVDRWRLIPTRANGQMAFAFYMDDRDGAGGYRAYAIDVAALNDAGQLTAMNAFRDPDLRRPEAFERFGLPLRLDG